MTIPTPTDPGNHARRLVEAYVRSGYARVAPAILQPAEPFLDLSGEDMRRHMLVVTDSGGREFCLRPDLTIPVAQHYLATLPIAPAGFSYLGPVFRDTGEGSGEFQQAGIESFGRRDTAAADAEVLALGVDTVRHFGLEHPVIQIGDVALFGALLDALDLAPAWQRRLRKDFNRKSALAQDLDADDLERLSLAPHGHAEYQGVLAALADANPKAAHALVTDLLSIAGISAVGGRSIGEIADRFVEQAELGASPALPQEKRLIIARFLGVAGSLGESGSALRKLAADARLALDPALDLFEERARLLSARGVNGSVRFATGFCRGVDYYSGFVFELHDPTSRVSGQLVAGGRYDGLLTRLGAAQPVPAVGFAAWIERLEAVCDLPISPGETP